MQGLNRLIQPSPVKLPRFRLDAAPSELCDPHDRQAHIGHSPRIFGPPVLRPMFGIVTDAKFHLSLAFKIERRRSGHINR